MSCTRMVRTDSWAKQLTDEQQRELYEMTKQSNMNWTKAIQWAVKEYGLQKIPSQTAFYKWRTYMFSAECRERAVDVAIATRRFCDLTSDDEIITTFKMLATEAALKGDAGTATAFSKCAATLHDRYIKQCEFDLKEQDRKNEALRNIAYAPYTEKLLKEFSLSMDEMIANQEKKLASIAPSAQPAANPPADATERPH